MKKHEILAALEAAQLRISQLQTEFCPDHTHDDRQNRLWHGLETVDDRLHDAMTLLGEVPPAKPVKLTKMERQGFNDWRNP